MLTRSMHQWTSRTHFSPWVGLDMPAQTAAQPYRLACVSPWHLRLWLQSNTPLPPRPPCQRSTAVQPNRAAKAWDSPSRCLRLPQKMRFSFSHLSSHHQQIHAHCRPRNSAQPGRQHSPSHRPRTAALTSKRNARRCCRLRRYPELLLHPSRLSFSAGYA